MTGIHFAMALIGTWRLTEIIMFDDIFAPIRNRLPRVGWLQKFWRCPFCVSWWAGGLMTLAFMYQPFLAWPFALSAIFIITKRQRDILQMGPKRGVFFEVDPRGSISVDWGGFDPNEGIVRIGSLLSQIEAAQKVRA